MFGAKFDTGITKFDTFIREEPMGATLNHLLVTDRMGWPHRGEQPHVTRLGEILHQSPIFPLPAVSRTSGSSILCID
jgi:hypothetical protein